MGGDFIKIGKNVSVAAVCYSLKCYLLVVVFRLSYVISA